MSKESPEFFPPSGSFRSVVPLSEIDETADASELAPPPATTLPAPPPKRIADGAQSGRARLEESGRWATEDEDEETLVTKRRAPSPPALAPRAGRRKSRLPSWRFLVPCLAAMLAGGVIADAFWKNFRRQARTDEAASVAQESPTAADGETPEAEAPPTAEATSTEQPQPAPQPSAAKPSSASEATSPNDEKALRAEITAATVVAPSAARKRPAPESPTEEPRERQPSSSARGAGNKSAAEPRAARPNAGPSRPARAAQNQVLTSSSREQSLPVFSPPPSDKSGKKDVIQWP